MSTPMTPAQAVENITDYLLENRREDVDYDDRETAANSVNTLAQYYGLPIAISAEQLDGEEDEDEDEDYSSY